MPEVQLPLTLELDRSELIYYERIYGRKFYCGYREANSEPEDLTKHRIYGVGETKPEAINALMDKLRQLF